MNHGHDDDEHDDILEFDEGEPIHQLFRQLHEIDELEEVEDWQTDDGQVHDDDELVFIEQVHPEQGERMGWLHEVGEEAQIEIQDMMEQVLFH